MDYRERWELKDYLIGRRLERRVMLLHGALILLLLAFALDFWYLQGVQGELYAGLAANNRERRIPVRPTRGALFDREQTVVAASRPSLNLVLRREETADRLRLESQLRELAPVLGTDYDSLAERLRAMRSRPQFEPLVLKEDASLAELAWIESRRERFPAVEVQQSVRRNYPEGALVAHVVGYVGEASEAQLAAETQLGLGDIVGKSGLERSYDTQLRGTRGWQVVYVNSVGRQVGSAGVGQPPHHGEQLELTLDMRLQRALVEALSAETGAGVFLDPWTGEVLALASTPTFDPNQFASGITRDNWRAISDDPLHPLHDRAIASFYAPGSTFKVLMAVAGLETHTVSPQETVFCSGAASFYGHTRLCWKKGGHGTVDMRRALAQSCNVYFYTLGKKLGIDAIQRYGSMFNLGRPTGVDLPGEENGVIPSDAWKRQQYGEPWYPGDTISVAIGQGLIAVTPVQMATLISAVATGGRLPHPHLRKAEAQPPVALPVAPGTFAVVQDALRRGVEEGTGRNASVGGITVAGKTGTAQLNKASAGIDADKLAKEVRDHAWFVGYAPAEKPRIAFAIIVEHGGHGGTTACPIARKVLEVFFAPELHPEGAAADLTAQARDVRATTTR
ncbi:MAG TPA: penicillin-binding protein 2 [Candidatus Polarisedimenticolaceae bacterium]|nr:penicillin-binding protein 2 [Candidatus Polarisedimenticolaceae bacterium]